MKNIFYYLKEKASQSNMIHSIKICCSFQQLIEFAFGKSEFKIILILAQVCLVFLFFENVNAQTDTTILNVDELYMKARELAFNNKYAQAREILFSILKHDDKHIDARILLGRTYAWEGKYDSARVNLKYVLANDSSAYDGYMALADVEFWGKSFNESLRIVNIALQKYLNDEEFLLKKARILKSLGRDEEALRILNRIEERHPLSSEAYSVKKEIGLESQSNSITYNYAIDAIPEQSPLQYAYLQYGKQTPIGLFFIRFNYSYRYKADGVQYEVDLYPRISKTAYGYINYGFSNSPLFPHHRVSGEFYSALPFHFEGSVGIRYLNFDSQSDVKIYTGTIGYYWRDYWFSLRPYFIPNEAGISKSLSFMVRYYFADAEDYLSARIGGGFTPDERYLQSDNGLNTTDIYYLDSQTIGVGIQKAIGLSYLIYATFDFTNQEKSCSPGSYYKMYSFNISLRWKF